MRTFSKSCLVLDARKAFDSGIGTYIRNLVPFFKQEFDLRLIGDKQKLEVFDCQVIHSASSTYSLSDFYQPSFLSGKCDVFWTPHFNYPIWPVKAKLKLATVHDMYHLAHFEKLSTAQKMYAKLVIAHTLKATDSIFTISEFTKSEILRFFPKTPSDKIEVVHLAVDNTFFKPTSSENEIQNLKTNYQLPDNYVLFVGNLKHNKNAISLVKAIEALHFKGKNYHHKLVIAGKKEGFRIGDNEVIDYIKNHKLEHLVHFTGFVNESDLPILYSAASLFVFPSLYEGFGLPPLEAIACGCPVLCSNMASIPEVCGNSTFYFDAQNTESLTNELEKLLANKELRKTKSDTAKEWIKQYDWSLTAEKHINIIKEGLSKI
ncbi:MAG TPA: glycosyltransferase family 1 protein [Cytophagales bacterium]|nr:glycosyltransferase family 1 protein [Cytophagales bacterium]